MQKTFSSKGRSYDVQYFHNENTELVRFYRASYEDIRICDYVLVTPSFGTILIVYVDDDAFISGSLNDRYFDHDMLYDLYEFLEENFPTLRELYVPYHVEFFSVSGFDEYTGETLTTI